jgi:hypothetical protein
LADCIDRGLDEVQVEQEKIREYVKDIKEVAATLEPGEGTCADRQEKFEELIDQLQRTENPIRLHMATVMVGFLAGLFVGEGKFEEIRETISILSDGSAYPRVTSGGFTVIATRGFVSSKTGRHESLHWTHTLRTLSHSPPRICCPIAGPENHPANVTR